MWGRFSVTHVIYTTNTRKYRVTQIYLITSYFILIQKKVETCSFNSEICQITVFLSLMDLTWALKEGCIIYTYFYQSRIKIYFFRVTHQEFYVLRSRTISKKYCYVFFLHFDLLFIGSSWHLKLKIQSILSFQSQKMLQAESE